MGTEMDERAGGTEVREEERREGEGEEEEDEESGGVPSVGLGERVTSEKKTVRRMKQMDVLRRQKDRSYKNVFKGSVLVSTLMDHDENKFSSRTMAIKFAQRLLDAGHIESIVGSGMFEDSVHLYRWADETVVREAKKMVSISSHIPKKKLIELVDMNAADTVDAYDMKDVKDKLIAKFQAERPAPVTFTSKEERRASRKERAARRRTLGAVQIGDAMDKLNDANSTLNNNMVNSTNLNRVGSLSQENLDTGSYTEAGGEERAVRPARRRVRSPEVTDTETDTETRSGHHRRRTRETSPALIDNKDMRSEHSTPTPTSPPPTPTSPPPTPTSPPPTTPTNLPPPNATDEEMEEVLKERPPVEVSGPAVDVCGPAGDVCGPAGDGDISTCVYDGIEMKALDIENLDFNQIRPKPNEKLMKINQGLEELTQQSYSFSDNEKHLLDQMRRMKLEHESVVTEYEARIKELLASLTDLRRMAEKLEAKNGLTPGSGGHEKLTDINGVLDDSSVSSESDATSLSSGGAIIPPAPTAPAPPPPPPPLGMSIISKVNQVKPTKALLKPRLKMRPLFWNRIILENKNNAKSENQDWTFWHLAQEPKFDLDAFERLFGKAEDDWSSKAKSLHDAMSSRKGKGKFQTAKILEENRSRAVAIKLRSMHCQMSDIKAAVYNMDYSELDLDSLYSLYLIRGTKMEVDKISVQLQCHDDPLDQPEQFLWELSQMSHFPERIECMMLQKRFNETLFNIDQQLSTVQSASDEIKQNQAMRTILEVILAYGNYMNGSTSRGQADGFEFTILSKIKDVKSMDNSTNLLQYLVRTYMKDNEEDAGKDEAVFRLPDPSQMSQAALVSFTDLDLELNNLQHQLQTHAKKAELVCLDTEHKLLQPFKDKMDDFFETAEAMLRDQQEKLTETRTMFKNLLAYLAVKDTTEQTTPESFFSVWANFCDNFKMYWKLEQKRIARMMFEKVEARKRARMRAARRRKSVAEDGKSNMKQRFAQMRRRSENINPTVKMLRSQSVVEAHAESDSELTRSAPSGDDGRRRRRRPQSEVYDTESVRRRPQSDTYETESVRRRAQSEAYDMDAVNYQSDASVTSTRSETMAERMQRRRRSRINSEEVQNNIQNARQENGLQRPADEPHKVRSYSVEDYTSDSEKIIRRRARAKSHTDEMTGGVGGQTGGGDKAGHRRRRAGVVSQEEVLNDVSTDDNTRPARQRYRKSDSLSSLTDVARSKPGYNAPYNTPITRYNNQLYNNETYHDQNNRHNMSPDPAAPPRPALPASYQYRPDTDIMETDQEKINYREAIRKMSAGPRKRSTDMSPKTENISPISRLR